MVFYEWNKYKIVALSEKIGGKDGRKDVESTGRVYRDRNVPTAHRWSFQHG